MTEEKKRIAILINTLTIGGAERAVSNLSLCFSDKYDVDILLNNDTRLDFPYRGRIISLGLPASGDRSGFFYQIRALCIRIKKLRELKKERGYAAVLSFSEMTNLTNVLAKDKEQDRKTKTILSVQNSVEKSIRNNWKYRLYARFILPFCVSEADFTVSCSQEIEAELIEKYGLPAEKSAVINNGIDLKRIKNMAVEPLPSEDREWMAEGCTVLSVGRLTHQKGHWHLIRVIRYLRKEGMDVRLMILGDGELRKKYIEMTGTLKSEDAVRLKGFVNNPFVYISRADTVVFPSLYEGFSNALVEILGCGAPCISSDHASGAREILAPDSDFEQKVRDRIEYAPYGILVPVCDGIFRNIDEPLSPEELLMAEAVRKMLTDRELSARYRTASVRRAAELGIREIAAQWSSLIEKSDRS